MEDTKPLVEGAVAQQSVVCQRTKKGLISVVIVCTCLFIAGGIAGCNPLNSKTSDDAAKPSRSWTVIHDVGIAEIASMVGSTTERRWIIKTPDSMSTFSLQSFKCDEGEVKWRGKPTEQGFSGVIFVGTKSALGACLVSNPGVLYAEEDMEVSVLHGNFLELVNSDSSNVRRLAEQPVNKNLWGLDRLDSENGLDRIYNNRGLNGQGVHVYVLDTGIRTTHNEFENRAIPTFDVTQGFPPVRCNKGDTSCAADRQGHGTHCAGTIAGKTFGVAKKAFVHAVKVLGDDGRGSEAGIIEAIDFVTAEGDKPAVISMSLGCSQPCQSRAEAAAIQAATRAGITVVVAAGNDGNSRFPNACDYAPANVPEAITVGSITDTNDQRSGFSNVGSCVDIFAPGSDILSSVHLSDTSSRLFSGTSMATPHVSGAAALLLGENRELTVQQVTNFIIGGSLKGKVKDNRNSPNRLLFIGKFPNANAPAPPPPTEPDEEIRFVSEISEGTCREDIFRGTAGVPINDVALCELAARVLGISDTTVSKTNNVARPEGCYVFRGNQLFMGVNPNSKGNGAGTSTRGRSRHPICLHIVTK